MKSSLMVFGGIFGAVIALCFILPTVLGLSAAISAGGEAVGFGHYLAIFFAGIAALALAGAPFFAVINYLEPENPLQFSSALIAAIGGALTVLIALISIFYGFSWMQLIAIVAGVLVVLSALLQAEVLDLG